MTCARGFFLKTDKKNPPFSKTMGYVWTEKNDLKTLRVDADFSKKGGKKLRFQNIRIREDGA